MQNKYRTQKCLAWSFNVRFSENFLQEWRCYFHFLIFFFTFQIKKIVIYKNSISFIYSFHFLNISEIFFLFNLLHLYLKWSFTPSNKKNLGSLEIVWDFLRCANAENKKALECMLVLALSNLRFLQLHLCQGEVLEN